MSFAWLGQMLTDAIEVGNIAHYLLVKESKETRVRCPYCGQFFDQKDIEGHIGRDHPEQPR